MTRQQKENFQELWLNVMDLAGDIIAMQNFFECKADCIENFGAEITATYLQRLADYTDQHTKEIRELKDILLIPELREITC